MAKTTVDDLVRSARRDALFDEEYTSPKARIRRVMSEALFRLRKGRELTQAALAEHAGWQQPYVAKIERGDAQMITALEGLEAFANATGCTTVVLFIDRETGQVRAQVPLAEAAVVSHLREVPATVVDQLTLVEDATLQALQADLERMSATLEQLRRHEAGASPLASALMTTKE